MRPPFTYHLGRLIVAVLVTAALAAIVWVPLRQGISRPAADTAMRIVVWGGLTGLAPTAHLIASARS